LTDSHDVTPVVAALKKSGFPLQTRIEHEIRERRSWYVLASEHPWRSEDGAQFIDLIANCGTVVLVVECKKAQERSLLFLRPVGRETGMVRRCTVWHFEPRGAGSSFGVDIKNIDDLQPASYQAEFCVSTDSSQRLLEQDARLVASAAEVLVEPFSQAHHLSRSFYVPTIVTTATLYTHRYEPPEIRLETGSFDKLDPKRIEQIRWVRFHKTFRVGDNARTVFVVNAAALPKFLDEISRGQGLGPAVAT
jgi:hypothetical protein